MAIEVKLPVLAEGVNSVEVIEVLVAVGDRVEDKQPVIEVETDKAAAEVPVTTAGIVKEIRVKIGDVLKVGQTFLVLDAVDGSGAAPASAKTAPATPAKKESPQQESASKAPAPAAAPPKPMREEAGAMPAVALMAPPSGKLVPAAPSVRRFARDLGVDVNLVPGSSAHGRVSKDDVKAYVKSINEGHASAPGIGAAAPPLPHFEGYGAVRRELMSKIRRRTAENMRLSTTLVPHVTQCDDADITRLEALRKRFAPRVEKTGGKLTMTAILVKIAAMALKKFPLFNASLDMQRNEIVYKEYYNVGVAVDTGKGLVVPVIRNADSKTISEIAADLADISQRARAGKTTIQDLDGGTFTISNVGGIGGTYFTPIVNYPEVAILGVGRAKQTPVFVEDGWEPRLMLPLSLSYDHRIIDGAEGIRFLRWVVDAMEEPLSMSL